MKTSMIALVAALTATPAFAAEDTDGNGSDTIVVIATRTPTKLSETAAPVSVVTADDIATRQSQSAFDALRLVPGLNIGGGPRSQGEMPAIRGFDKRQIILTVDGARRNTTETLRSPLYIDPSFLSRVEVLKGASSTNYGAGGLGSVMAFETISAQSQLEEGKDVGARAFAQYQSGSHAQRYGGQVYGRAGAVDAIFAVAFRDSGKIRMGGNAGDLDPADSNTKSWLAKVGANFGNFRAEASQKYFTLDDFGPNNPQADNSFVAKQPHNVTANETVFNLTGGSDSGNWTMKATLYRTSLRWRTDPYLNLTGSDTMTRTTGGSLLSTHQFSLAGITNKLTLGVDAYEERNQNVSNGSPDTVNPDGKQTVFGAFAQNEIGLAPWLSVTPALRWDQFKTSVDTAVAPDQKTDRVTFKGTIAARPVEGLLLWASYGEAYRAPTVSELYQSLIRNNALFNFTPNNALKPESAEEFDIGLGYHAAGLFAGGDRLSVRASWFTSSVSDLITSRTVGSFTRTFPFSGTGLIFQYQNVSKARRRGLEAEIAYGIGPVDFSAAYSRVRSVDRNTGENLFSSPDKLALTAGVRIVDAVKVNWTSQIVWAQDYDTTVIRRRAAYDVHDAFVTITPASLPVRLDLGVTNIFDKRYALYKNSTANPNTFEEGRSLRATLTTRF